MLILTFTVTGVGSLSTFAYNSKLVTKGLYISTAQCPDGYMLYTIKNIARFIMTLELGEFPVNGLITLGTPFCFGNEGSDIFYFPILCDGNIVFMFRVFPTPYGGYDGVLGKTFVDDLNRLAEKTTETRPLTIIMEGNKVVTYIGTEREVIFEYPTWIFSESIAVALHDINMPILSRSIVVNAKANDLYDLCINHGIIDEPLPDGISRGILAAYPSSYYIPINTTFENQNGNDWCNAYATACIFRITQGTSTTAYSVMNRFYSPPKNTDWLSDLQVQLYANYQGLYPTITGTLSYSTLADEISNYRPLIMGMSRTLFLGHAVVLRGYDMNNAIWSIWNPWYTFCESFNMGGTYVPATNTTITYTYTSSIYHFI